MVIRVPRYMEMTIPTTCVAYEFAIKAYLLIYSDAVSKWHLSTDYVIEFSDFDFSLLLINHG